MAALVVAGIDHRPYATASDSVWRILDTVVGERVLEWRNKQREATVHSMANSIGNVVGGHVGRALNAALQSISQAMSRRA